MLTAREWLLLSKDEQERRGKELNPHESFLLRTELAYVHFSESEKANMPEEKKQEFLHPKKYTNDEREKLLQEQNAIFETMIKEVEQQGNEKNESLCR